MSQFTPPPPPPKVQVRQADPDPIPQNLCILPFMHLSSKPDGKARICCFTQSILRDSRKKPLRFGERPLREIWNGNHIKAIRQRMLAGERLSICQACFDEEAAGKESKRIRENRRFLSRPLLEEAKANGGHIASPPSYLDLRLGNFCNLKCRTCGPLCSSSWQREIKRAQIAESPLRHDHPYSGQPAQDAFHWHKTSRFFETVKESGKNLKVLYMSGGEPLLMKEWLNILKRLVAAGDFQHITLRLNSNITALPELFMREALHFPRIDFGASIDGAGRKNEYLRPPSKWPDIHKNMERLWQLSRKYQNLRPYIHYTVSAFNVLSVGEILDFARSLSLSENKQSANEERDGGASRLKSGAAGERASKGGAENRPGRPSRPEVSFNILHGPEYQHVSILPPILKQKALSSLQKLKQAADLTPQERRGLSAIIHLLHETKEDTKEIVRLRERFKEHVLFLDRLRNEDFYSVFPEFQGAL